MDDLEDICDKKCRRQQEDRLEHVCAEKPYLKINPGQESPVRSLIRRLISSDNSGIFFSRLFRLFTSKEKLLAVHLQQIYLRNLCTIVKLRQPCYLAQLTRIHGASTIAAQKTNIRIVFSMYS